MIYLIRQGNDFLETPPFQSNGYMPKWSLNKACIFPGKDDVYFSQILFNTIQRTDTTKEQIVVDAYSHYRHAIHAVADHYRNADTDHQTTIENTLMLVFHHMKDRKQVQKDLLEETK